MVKKPFVPPTLKEEASLAEVTLFTGAVDPCSTPGVCV
jgi:hypothetical protein